MSLDIETERHGDITVLLLRGDLDVATAPQLRSVLVEAITDGARILVDLEAVGFLDSVGLGILVSGLKRARDGGGELELICTSRQVLRPFELTGLDKAFTMHRGRDAAGLA